MFLLNICALLLSASLSAYEIPTHWEHSHYIWNFDLIAHAQKGITRNPEQYFAHEPRFNPALYQDIHKGDIVWIKGCFLPDFCTKVLPTLNQPIILLVADGDESFPSECGDNSAITQLLESPYIVHIFAQNNDYTGPSNKISSIPIGMDFHTVAYKSKNGGWGQIGTPRQQEEQLQTIFSFLKPTNQRKKRAFVDFQHSDTLRGGYLHRYKKYGEDRTSIFNRLKATGLIDYGPWMSRANMWRTKGEYAFSISPHGNGIDCHRTWEDLILGCIVIVKTSVLDVLYKDLPVVIVKDWDEITQENMHKWLTQYGDAFTNPVYRERLTNRYWYSTIESMSTLLKGAH
jgi:hypothetical protein